MIFHPTRTSELSRVGNVYLSSSFCDSPLLADSVLSQPAAPDPFTTFGASNLEPSSSRRECVDFAHVLNAALFSEWVPRAAASSSLNRPR